MLSEEVLAIRRTGIAATDAAPIVKLSPWATPADIWVQKKHPELVPPKKSKSLHWGTKLEDVIADEYAVQTGQNLVKSPLVCNKKLPWLMCSPDRLVAGKKKGAECKTADGMNKWEWGPSGTDRVPAHYLIQVTHSMMVLNYDEWDVAVLIGGNDFRIYHVYRDDDLFAQLFEQEKEFYERFILGSETPEFDWGKGLSDFVAAKYPVAKPRVKGQTDHIFDVDANGDATLKKALQDLLAARELQNQGEEAEDIQKALIQAYMRDHESLRYEALNKLLITWRNIKDSVKVDWVGILHELIPHIDLPASTKRDIFLRHIEKRPGGRQFRVYDKKASKKEESEA